MRAAVVVCALAAGMLGCGLGVRSADLFLLTRAGQGHPLTLLVSDAGTVRCNGGASKMLSSNLLLVARTLAGDLDKDAKAGLRVAPSAGSVARYTVKLQDGTISFPDTAAASHREFAQAELFTAQAAQSACGIAG